MCMNPVLIWLKPVDSWGGDQFEKPLWKCPLGCTSGNQNIKCTQGRPSSGQKAVTCLPFTVNMSWFALCTGAPLHTAGALCIFYFFLPLPFKHPDAATATPSLRCIAWTSCLGQNVVRRYSENHISTQCFCTQTLSESITLWMLLKMSPSPFSLSFLFIVNKACLTCWGLVVVLLIRVSENFSQLLVRHVSQLSQIQEVKVHLQRRNTTQWFYEAERENRV